MTNMYWQGEGATGLWWSLETSPAEERYRGRSQEDSEDLVEMQTDGVVGHVTVDSLIIHSFAFRQKHSLSDSLVESAGLRFAQASSAHEWFMVYGREGADMWPLFHVPRSVMWVAGGVTHHCTSWWIDPHPLSHPSLLGNLSHILPFQTFHSSPKWSMSRSEVNCYSRAGGWRGTAAAGSVSMRWRPQLARWVTWPRPHLK